ncbi:hypothetical protein SLEP1_g52400 [Rubroshorea leprosula]|uniref:Reverse transcriptase domain-containing protein n=1 Tax=Rubroshorea leprosula TaxID=152421 RepID=A0AAV5M650_9ROSI|nr:hypothetical protein SLEP1_g52400 [Rubroshorea leprosula]
MERRSARVKVRFPVAKDSGSGLKRQFSGSQDVFTPARRDRKGRRFGFVRMSKVSDAKDLEQKLNQIWLGSYRLKVKLAETIKRERVVSARNPNRQFEKKWIRRESKVTSGMTYAQVVAGNMVTPEEWMSSNKDVKQDELTKGKEPVEDVVLEKIPEKSTAPVISAGRVEERYSPKIDLVLEFTPKDEEVAWLKRSMVAMVRSLDMVKKIQNRLDVDGLMVNVALLDGHHVILVDYSEGCLEEFISHNSELAWSERCFTELGGLIGEVILVDEDTRMQEEEWRMDPDWWLAGERRNSMVESDSENSDDGLSESTFNENGFLGDDGAVLAEDGAATERDSNFLLQKEVDLNEEDLGVNKELNGLETFGRSGGSFNGPHKCGEVEQQVEDRSVEDGFEYGLEAPYVQIARPDRTEKKRRSLGTIYAMVIGMEEARKVGTSWVTARTKARRNRRDTDLQMGEVRELFVMGHNLGIRCQQNDEEVISRLVALEETKLEGVEVSLCRKLWYSKDFDWVMQKSVGNSGGEWGKQRLKCNLVNVYAACDRQRKAMLWEEMGRPDGSSMSRLDRVLLSTEMSLLDREWVQVGMRRSISDHCALILTSRNIDWGPKPFRVLDAWQQHPNFKGFVEDKWKTLQIEGWAGFKCKQKLKLLKDECKGWNRGVFGNVEIQLDTLLKHIGRLDKKSEAEELSENEVLLRKKCFQEMWDIFRRKEAVWRQKSRNNWVRLGDANTAFFHRCVQTRRAQNAISGILGDEGWIEEPELIKAEAVKYFSELFHKEQWSRPVMGGIQFRKISAAQKEWLERPFSIEEIEEGLRSCDGSKAPGPDGFNFNFIKFAWNTLKDDFVNFLMEFHQHGRLVKGLNSSFLALIPKKLNPVQFKEYRPICLIGCLYKLLAKVLANRLKRVMADIISESQSAFVGGRQLVDSVLVLNEVVDEVKRKKQESFIFKADFEKAYDCVDWDFLDWMMDRMGFGVKWRKWIRECLSTARISILLNGSPTSEFSISKGLRQGDPLSPFLFLLVGEGLCGLVKKAECEGLLKGLEIGRGGMELSLLQFADGTVFMGKACAGNLKVVKAILHWFELISGLKINFSKSHLYGFNTSEGWLRGAAEILHCGVGRVPFIYLGLPVGGNPGRKKFWNSVLDRFRHKLATWKSPLLSFGGRITLINSGQFREMINGVRLRMEEADSWQWLHGRDGIYSVKAAYDFLSLKVCVLDEK